MSISAFHGETSMTRAPAKPIPSRDDKFPTEFRFALNVFLEPKRDKIQPRCKQLCNKQFVIFCIWMTGEYSLRERFGQLPPQSQNNIGHNLNPA